MLYSSDRYIESIYYTLIPDYKHTVKPEKNTMIKFHENALKQFSRRLKFTNLASEPQKISNLPFYVS